MQTQLAVAVAVAAAAAAVDIDIAAVVVAGPGLESVVAVERGTDFAAVMVIAENFVAEQMREAFAPLVDVQISQGFVGRSAVAAW